MRTLISICALVLLASAEVTFASVDVETFVDDIFPNVRISSTTRSGTYSTTSVSTYGGGSATAESRTVIRSGEGTSYRVEIRTEIDGIEKTYEQRIKTTGAEGPSVRMRLATSSGMVTSAVAVTRGEHTEGQGFLEYFFARLASFFSYIH